MTPSRTLETWENPRQTKRRSELAAAVAKREEKPLKAPSLASQQLHSQLREEKRVLLGEGVILWVLQRPSGPVSNRLADLLDD